MIVFKKPKKQNNELHLQHAIVDFLLLKKIFCWVDYQPPIAGSKQRQRHYSSKGVADILGIYKGKPLAIEVKYGKGRLQPHQKEFLDRFEKEGGIAFVAYSIDEVIEKLKL